MSAGWIAFEIFINIVEVGTIFYLLCKKFPAKRRTGIWTALFAAANIIYLSVPLFVPFKLFPPVEIVTFIFYLVFLMFLREGSVWKKIFWVSLMYSILFVISYLSTTITSILSGLSSLDIMTRSSGVRFLMMATAKIVQIVVFYFLSLNKKRDVLFNRTLVICFIVPLISCTSGIVINETMLTMGANYNVPDIIVYVISVSYLLINIVFFILYEIINKEAEKSYLLMAKHRQYEAMEQHNAEILKIYSDIREWRHDYANHMQVVMALIEKSKLQDSDINEAVNYIKNIDGKITTASLKVSTGNYIVDSIISAKLTLASSFDIKFDYNCSVTNRLTISDTNLCTLLSNLLDNAIDACCKLEDGRYIDIEIIEIKNQLYIKIKNSANGEYIKEGGKFKTTKKDKWHGIGLRHVENIVEEHGGISSIETDANSFTVRVSIPLKWKQ